MRQIQSPNGFFGLDVALGKIPGYSPWTKFGYNSAVGTTRETIWALGSDYEWPAAAASMTVSSKSAADVASNSGASVISIMGLDNNWAIATEEITMDGVTGVWTENQYIRMLRATNESTGQDILDQISVGTGAITAGVPAKVYTAVFPDDGQTEQSITSIPAGHIGILLGYYYGAGKSANTAIVELFVRKFGKRFVNKEHLPVKEAAGYMQFPVPRIYPEKTDLECKGTATGGSLDIAMGLDMILCKV